MASQTADGGTEPDKNCSRTTRLRPSMPTACPWQRSVNKGGTRTAEINRRGRGENGTAGGFGRISMAATTAAAAASSRVTLVPDGGGGWGEGEGFRGRAGEGKDRPRDQGLPVVSRRRKGEEEEEKVRKGSRQQEEAVLRASDLGGGSTDRQTRSQRAGRKGEDGATPARDTADTRQEAEAREAVRTGRRRCERWLPGTNCTAAGDAGTADGRVACRRPRLAVGIGMDTWCDNLPTCAARGGLGLGAGTEAGGR